MTASAKKKILLLTLGLDCAEQATNALRESYEVSSVATLADLQGALSNSEKPHALVMAAELRFQPPNTQSSPAVHLLERIASGKTSLPVILVARTRKSPVSLFKAGPPLRGAKRRSNVQWTMSSGSTSMRITRPRFWHHCLAGELIPKSANTTGRSVCLLTCWYHWGSVHSCSRSQPVRRPSPCSRGDHSIMRGEARVAGLSSTEAQLGICHCPRSPMQAWLFRPWATPYGCRRMVSFPFSVLNTSPAFHPAVPLTTRHRRSYAPMPSSSVLPSGSRSMARSESPRIT